MTSDPNTETKHAAPLSLWRAMRAFLCLLFDLFGEPETIAARGALSRETRALFTPWLRAGEAFLRRLLFIEALALAAAAPAHSNPPRRAARTRRLFHFYADKPEDWRVSFRLFPAQRGECMRGGCARRTTRRQTSLPPMFVPPQKPPEDLFWRALARGAHRQPRHGASRLPRDMSCAWPFAERLEAMLRVFSTPRRAAQRLARALQRNEAKAMRVLTPVPAPIVDLIGPEHFARCNAIVASRRRKRERAQAALASADSS